MQSRPGRRSYPKLDLFLVGLPGVETMVILPALDLGREVVEGRDRQRRRLGDEAKQELPQVARQPGPMREEEAKPRGSRVLPITGARPAKIRRPAVLGLKPPEIQDALRLVDGLLNR